MLKETAKQGSRPTFLLSAAFLTVTLLGTSFAQAQGAPSAAGAEARTQSGAAARGIEKSDIKRGHTRIGDSDGDGLSDPPLSGSTVTGGNGEEQETQRSKKKMKRLKPTESEPLELMDETDTCPRLPCP